MVRITGAQARIAHHVSMGHTNSDVAAIYKHAGVVNRNELIQAYRTGRLGVEDAHGEQHHHA
jgi:hypothetical protein